MSARPYVICHMMSSVDGRIQSLRWGVKDAAQFFEKQAAKIKVDAWMVGRKTMQEFSSKAARRARKTSARIGKQDFIAAGEAKSFAVVIDPSGKCNWQESEVEAGVSYLFAGKRQLDLQLVLEKLAQHFGIERVRLDGGGGNNGSFLAAGLIDELSLVLMPVADGSTGTPTVFDAGPGDSRHKSAKLTLQSVKRLDGGALWLRYLVER
jgi:2,5-diamino-6-(ribosylamino)-4(3H)-pyrimidinone 5'-phosphate reductase